MRLPALPEATSCFRFDGTSSYVSASFTPSVSAFSATVWVKPSKMAAATQRIFDWADSGPVNGFSVYLNTSNRYLLSTQTFNGAGSSGGGTTTNDLNANTWSHITFTFSGTATIVYVNGLSVLSTSGTVTASSSPFTIGKRAGQSTGYFNGLMADARVYNRVLTATEALNLSQGKDIDSTSLALRWIGNQNGGATVPDASGNGNTGTFTTPFYLRDSPFYPVRSRVGGNLIYNGDFQIRPLSDNVATTTTNRWIDGTAAGSNSVFPSAIGWSITGSNSFAALMDTTTKYSGAASLKLSTTAVASYAEARDYSASSSLPFYRAHLSPVRPSTSYTLTFMMKTTVNSGTSNSTGGGVQLVDINSAGSSTRFTTVGGVNTTTGWTRYSQVITTSSDTQFLSVRPLCYGHQGSANLIMDAWFDEITLTETTPVTRSTATGRLAVRDFGTSLAFNGTSDKISIGTGISPTTAITYSAWIKPTTPKANQRVIALYSHSSIRLDTNGRVAFVIHGIVEYFGTSRLNPNSWYHIAATYDRTSVKIYVNGVLESTTAETRAFPSTTSAGWIGTYDGGVQFFKGVIDQPCIHSNRALSASEVSELYYNGLTRGSALATGLVGEWLFNEGSGSTAYDSSGNGNNGTITGATYSTDVPCVNRSAV